MTYQPGDQLRLPRIQAVQLGELQRILRAENRVIAVAAFSDIVQQRRHQQQLLLRQARPKLDAKRMHRARRLAGEALQLLQHTDSVLVDGVCVKQVELHLSDDMSPQRRIGPEHAVTVHRQQGAFDRAGMAQNRHKELTRLRDLTQRLLEMAARVAQLAQRG